MNNTLFENDHILIYKHPITIQAGNVVILKANNDTSIRNAHPTLVKRVIATEGDTILFQKAEHLGYNRYTISLSIKKKGASSFVLCDEPNNKEDMEYYDYDLTSSFYGLIDVPLKVPNGKIFVLGDNRNQSVDSRQLGFFSKSDVIGKMSIKLKKDSFFERLFLLIYRNDED